MTMIMMNIVMLVMVIDENGDGEVYDSDKDSTKFCMKITKFMIAFGNNNTHNDMFSFLFDSPNWLTKPWE